MRGKIPKGEKWGRIVGRDGDWAIRVIEDDQWVDTVDGFITRREAFDTAKNLGISIFGVKPTVK